jgi:hypothetical protein
LIEEIRQKCPDNEQETTTRMMKTWRCFDYLKKINLNQKIFVAFFKFSLLNPKNLKK